MNPWDMDPNGYAPLLKLLRQWWQARRKKRSNPPKIRCEQGCRA